MTKSIAHRMDLPYDESADDLDLYLDLDFSSIASEISDYEVRDFPNEAALYGFYSKVISAIEKDRVQVDVFCKTISAKKTTATFSFSPHHIAIGGVTNKEKVFLFNELKDEFTLSIFNPSDSEEASELKIDEA